MEKHPRVYEFDDFRLDAAKLMLYRAGQEIPLPPKVLKTLLALIESGGEILSKDELMNRVWGDTTVEESNLSQHIYLLRKTLGAARSDGRPFIETLRRRGYRFNGEVRAGVETQPPEQFEFVEAVAPEAEFARAIPQAAPHASPNLSETNRHKAGRWWWAALALGAALVTLVTLGLSSWRGEQSAASVVKSRATKGELTITSLTNGEDVNDATISPDGKYFVYHSQDGAAARLWLQQTGQSNRVEIAPLFAGSIYGKTFTPDGQFIYFTAAENPGAPTALYRVPALGGAPTKILTDTGAHVSFSPDGREMVFSRYDRRAGRSSLSVAASDGTRERVLLTRAGDEGITDGAAWSPDGKLIAFGAVNLRNVERGTHTIVGVDPRGGEVKPLSPEGWDVCYKMAWTRDGRGLVFVGTKANEILSARRDQIYYLSIESGDVRRLTNDGNRYQPTLGVTGGDEILAVQYNRSSQIWAIGVGGDARDAVQITNGQADGRGGLAPLADGRVSYLTRAGDGFAVWLMNADGSDRKQLTIDPSAIEELRAAPDGRFFIFSARRDGRNHLFRVDEGGANFTQLTSGEGNEIDSAVSPDGKSVVYASFVRKNIFAGNRLQVIPAGGGEPARLSDADCATPHFSPDGKFVSCVRGGKEIVVISIADGSIVKTFEAVGMAVLNVGARWTPDGRGLTYIVHRENAGNLWRQPLAGGRPQPLTNFTSGHIYNYAFSHDGSRLYVARGYPIRNAVLIKNFAN